MSEIQEAAFMLSLGSTDEEIEKSLEYMVKQSTIHAAILCPQESGEQEWAVSIVPIGKVISATVVDGVPRVKFITTEGELLRL